MLKMSVSVRVAHRLLTQAENLEYRRMILSSLIKEKLCKKHIRINKKILTKGMSWRKTSIFSAEKHPAWTSQNGGLVAGMICDAKRNLFEVLK